MRTEEQAAYQAAAEAVVATEFGAEVFGLRIKSVEQEIGMEDWEGRCLRAGGVLEFCAACYEYDEKDRYAFYAGEDALVDRIRRIGMCRFARLAGHELLTGEPDKYAELPAIISKIPTGDISGLIPEGEVVEVEVEDEVVEVEEVEVGEDALFQEYLEQSKELLQTRWSVVQALAQRLLSQRSLKAEEIAEVLEVSDT